MAKNSGNDKLYYSISEVARMTGLEAYVLRYWEKEFPTLKPTPRIFLNYSLPFSQTGTKFSSNIEDEVIVLFRLIV